MKKILVSTFGLLATVSITQGANLIVNGSFEVAGTTGTNSFTGWTKQNIPVSFPASVIIYNSPAAYPNGAFGESVAPDNSVSSSPDLVGTHAAYFVSDVATNERFTQLTWLTPGNYRIGFSYYLTANGLGNINNSSISGNIIGIPVASTTITGSSTAGTWFSASGVGQITVAGFYTTSLNFNSNGNPAKDVVVDRVYAISTLDAPTIIIPPTPDFIPEPATFLLSSLGGILLLRRKR